MRVFLLSMPYGLFNAVVYALIDSFVFHLGEEFTRRKFVWRQKILTSVSEHWIRFRNGQRKNTQYDLAGHINFTVLIQRTTSVHPFFFSFCGKIKTIDYCILLHSDSVYSTSTCNQHWFSVYLATWLQRQNFVCEQSINHAEKMQIGLRDVFHVQF